MKKKTVKVSVDQSVDSRPVAMLVQVASQFDSSITRQYINVHVAA